MTDVQLDELEKLAEAATPGPWTARLTDRGHALWGPLPSGECGSMRIALSSYAAFDRANMLFVEALRDAALPLVKALREAREALDQVSSDDRMSEAQIIATIRHAQAQKDEAIRQRNEARALLAVLKEEHRPADEIRAQLLAEIEAHAETKAEVERLREALRVAAAGVCFARAACACATCAARNALKEVAP